MNRNLKLNVLLSLMAIALTGCAGDSDIVAAGNVLWSAIGKPPVKISREQAAAIPFATMGLQLGSNAQAILILGANTPEALEWFAGQQIYVATNRGRIVRTSGMPYDLGGLREELNANSQGLMGKATWTYALDLPDLGIFGTTLRCMDNPTGPETIDILGASISTVHIRERCEAQGISWKFENEFWQDPMTGYVWRSKQYIHPKSPPVTLETLRPESRD